MTNGSSYTKADLIAQLDSAHAHQGRAQRQLLATIADADKAGVWIADGARNMASWVATRYGVSHYRAEKWVSCAHKLGSLPRIAEALATGQLSLDKTVELTRIATPRDEAHLLKWARRVTTKGIRDKAQASEHDPRDVRARETRALSHLLQSP